MNRLLIVLALLMVCLGCREGSSSYSTQAEGQVLNSGVAQPSSLTLTIEGLISCASCPRNESSMIIDVLAPNRVEPELIAPAVYGQLGAYAVTASVPFNELIRVRAVIYAPGGVQTIEKDFVTTGDMSLVAQKLEMNLDTADK